ncbi:MAG: metallophosphoesterase [Halobacteria archaeon]
MLIGLISDVHGNLPALDTVLDDMPDVGVILHAGDVIGYNPYPGKVIERFQEKEIKTISGNHDRALSTGSTFGFHSAAGQALEWTEKQLSEEEIEFIKSLPVKENYLDGSIVVAHGSPDNPDKYVYPREFSPRLLDTENLLVLGHTHVQGSQEFDSGTVVNPGSVGQPRDGDPRSGYAVFDTDTGDLSLERVEYPVEEVQERIRDAKLPMSLAERLSQGR